MFAATVESASEVRGGRGSCSQVRPSSKVQHRMHVCYGTSCAWLIGWPQGDHGEGGGGGGGGLYIRSLVATLHRSV